MVESEPCSVKSNYFWHFLAWWRGHFLLVWNNSFCVLKVFMCYNLHWQMTAERSPCCNWPHKAILLEWWWRPTQHTERCWDNILSAERLPMQPLYLNGIGDPYSQFSHAACHSITNLFHAATHTTIHTVNLGHIANLHGGGNSNNQFRPIFV